MGLYKKPHEKPEVDVLDDVEVTSDGKHIVFQSTVNNYVMPVGTTVKLSTIVKKLYSIGD